MDDTNARSFGMTTHPSLRFGHDELMLDDDTVDRLLDGLAPADAPPSYEWVAEALGALRAPGAPDAEAEQAALALFRAARDEVTVVEVRRPLRRIAGQARDAGARARSGTAGAPGRARRVGLVAGAVAGLSLVTATSAAAMTGALPAPAQRAAHNVLSVVGVHLPAPAHVPGPPASGRLAPIAVSPGAPFTSHAPGVPTGVRNAVLPGSLPHTGSSHHGGQHELVTTEPVSTAPTLPAAGSAAKGHDHGEPAQSDGGQNQGNQDPQGQATGGQQGPSSQSGGGQQAPSGPSGDGGGSGSQGHGHGHGPH